MASHGDYVTVYVGVDARTRLTIIRSMVNSFQLLNPVWLQEHGALQAGVQDAGRMLDAAEAAVQLPEGRELAFAMATVAEVLICGVQVAAHGQNILDYPYVRTKHRATTAQVEKIVRHVRERLQRLGGLVTGVVRLAGRLKAAGGAGDERELAELRTALQRQVQEAMRDIDDGDWKMDEGDASVMQHIVKKLEGYVKMNVIIYVVVVIIFMGVVIMFFFEGSYSPVSWASLACSFTSVFLCQVARRQLVRRLKIIMDYQLRKYLLLGALSHVEAIIKEDSPRTEDIQRNQTPTMPTSLI